MEFCYVSQIKASSLLVFFENLPIEHLVFHNKCRIIIMKEKPHQYQQQKQNKTKGVSAFFPSSSLLFQEKTHMKSKAYALNFFLILWRASFPSFFQFSPSAEETFHVMWQKWVGL